MHRPASARRLRAALLLVAISAVGPLGCGASAPGGKASSKGTSQTSFDVTVGRPDGGRVVSVGADGLPDGVIDCGTSATACGPASYAWSATVRLTAIPDAGNMLGSWAGDCQYRGPCVLDTSRFGADKYVVAVFGPVGLTSHGNFTDPALHGPAYIDYVKGRADSFACDKCHVGWNGVGIAPSCNTCHAEAGFPDWRTDCGFCHGFPPETGAHRAHFDLPGAGLGGSYGDTRILQDLYPAATPTGAPAAYGFACGNCHPLDPARHMDGSVDVELRSASAPAGSLKAKAAATAAYAAATGTCNGTYCHSTGQATPVFKPTPSWSTGKFAPATRCSQCHDDPPAYATSGTTPNSHAGHVLGMPGRSHQGAPVYVQNKLYGSQHGSPAAYQAVTSPSYGAWDASPMTCQTCHFDTVDPKNTTLAADGTPVGYYYLDTGGSQGALCAGCHTPGGNPGTGNGKALPLRHVNGTRDVRFDPRSGDHDGPAGQSLTDEPWLPIAPGTAYAGVRKPTKPYWITNVSAVNWGCGPKYPGFSMFPGYGGTAYCPPGAVWTANYYYFDPSTIVTCRNYPSSCAPAHWEDSWLGTISFSLANATYDAQRKSCSSVGCHLGSWSYPEYDAPTWGVRARNCFPCHRNP